MRALNTALSTKPETGTRKRHHGFSTMFIVVIALMALVTTAPAAPALYPHSPSPDVAIVPRLAADGGLHLDVTGLWPTPCLPNAIEFSEWGGELRLEARTSRGLCQPMTMPFRFDVDIAARLGHALLPGDYRVFFHAANGAAAPLELRGFGMISVGGTPVVPESGYWWPQTNEKDSINQGIALNIENQGEQIAVGLLAYASDGSPTWYFGTGRRGIRSASLEAVAMRQGPDLFGSTRRRPYPDERIRIELAFTSAGRLTAWFGRYELGKDQPVLRLSKVEFARMSLVAASGLESWQGDWLLATTTNGEASVHRLRLEVSQQLDSEHFRLGVIDGTNLTCHIATEHAAAIPESCTLSDPEFGEIRFDSIGLHRMDGTDHFGNSATLQRLR